MIAPPARQGLVNRAGCVDVTKTSAPGTLPGPSKADPAPHVARAKAALAAGNLAGAWSDAELALAIAPDDTETLYVAAVIERFRGRLPQALAFSGRLIALCPHLGRAQQERGHALRQAGDRDGAVRAYEAAVALNPTLTGAWKMLATICAGHDDALAARAQREVQGLSAQPAELMAALAAWHDQEWRLAETRVRAYLGKAPDDPVAMRLLAELGTRMGEYEDAEFILEQCVAFHPDFLPARFDYADVLARRFRYDEALAQATVLVEREPDSVPFQTLRANQLLQVGETEAALTAFDGLHARDPGAAHISLTRGHALKTLGRMPDAIAAYRAAYGARADFGDAWWSLANLKTFRFLPDDVAAMTALEAREGIDTEDRIHLCFALGKAHEDAGDHALAFACYARGNALRQDILQYRPEAVTAEMAAQISACTPQLFAANAGGGCPADDPIFIVGLPRAGSTLLEQILASHSMVEGTMELPDIMAIAARLNGRQAVDEAGRYPSNLGEIAPGDFSAMGEGYIAATRVYRREGRPRFIDKMPNNFRHIGLIHLILPNARIIDARRAPLACGFSLFKQLFAQGQDFSYDLAHIGRYYTDYLDLMDHWDRVLPGRVLRVQHEDVLDDLEGQVRRMLDFCGLPFEPGCMDFHTTPRAVRTPSAEQVRRPLNRDGEEAWKPFASWLEPLRTQLARRPDLVVEG
jgi:tetratricopeptide (TPR) repeat protein